MLTPRWLEAARKEALPLATLSALAALALAFSRITDEVVEGETHGFDRAVLTALRDADNLRQPIGPAWVTQMALDITALGSLAVLGLIVLLVAGLYASVQRFRAALILVASAGLGLALSQAFKALIGRERPDAIFQLAPTLNASFPSGHAMLSAVVFLTLGAGVARFTKRRRVKIYALAAAILLTLLVGLSRVYLADLEVGVLTSLLGAPVFCYLLRKRMTHRW